MFLSVFLLSIHAHHRFRDITLNSRDNTLTFRELTRIYRVFALNSKLVLSNYRAFTLNSFSADVENTLFWASDRIKIT